MKLQKFMPLVLMILAFFMKVKSVLYSEMRGKLGDQVVGSAWKGRMTLRSYKTPANPKTLKQLAVRDHHTKVLSLYQSEIKDDVPAETAWNTDALPRNISGYNLFMKLGRSNVLSCPSTEADPNAIDITYTVQVDLSSAALYVLLPDGTTFEEILAPGGMLPGDDQTEPYTPMGNGSHVFYIVDARSKTMPPVDGDRMALCNNWKPNESTGVADSAVCVYSGI